MPRPSPMLAFLALALPLAAHAHAQASRPNIVVLLSDDQNAGDLGCAGHPFLRTPHLDRLAAEGARFEAALVTSALCSPSRASFLTGAYARHHRILSNFEELGEELPTLAAHLDAAGYRSAYVGKWHMGVSGDPRPGFHWTASYGGHGKVRDAHFLVGAESTVKVKTEGWVDDVATDYAIEFLRRSRTRPLLLCLGFKSPHTPRQPDARHAQLYGDVTLPQAAAPLRLPPYPTRPEYRALLKASGLDKDSYTVPEDWLESWQGERLPETELLGGSGHGEDLRNYYRLLTGMDENVGRLLATLEELGILDNTLVVFASDNGLLNGRLGVYGKRSAYEEAVRVPLIVRPPRREGAPQGLVRQELALNVDLLPTLLDYAGLPAAEGLPGRSLRPLVEAAPEAAPDSAPPAWREGALLEFLPERASAFPELLAWRTPRWKLITYPGRPAWTELFDLQADPDELRNLARDPAHGETLARVLQALALEHARLGPAATHQPERGTFR